MNKHEIQINRPVADVHRAYLEPDSASKWISQLKDINHVQGEPGEVGAVTKMLYLSGGRRTEMIRTITANESEYSLSGTIEGPDMAGEFQTEFIEQGDSTIVRTSENLRGTTLFMSLILYLMRGSIRNRHGRDLQTLKKMLESAD